MKSIFNWSGNKLRNFFSFVELILMAFSTTIGTIGVILSSKSLLITAGISFLISLLINYIVKKYDKTKERLERERWRDKNKS